MAGVTAGGDHRTRDISSDAADDEQLPPARSHSLTTMRGVGAVTSSGWWVLQGSSGYSWRFGGGIEFIAKVRFRVGATYIIHERAQLQQWLHDCPLRPDCV